MLGESVRMPLPFDAVHSGKTTIAESGFSCRSVESGIRRADGEGASAGGDRARNMAWTREMR